MRFAADGAASAPQRLVCWAPSSPLTDEQDGFDANLPAPSGGVVRPSPTCRAIFALHRQIEIMLVEPKQSLPGAAEFRDFIEDQGDGLLHAAVRVLLIAIGGVIKPRIHLSQTAICPAKRDPLSLHGMPSTPIRLNAFMGT